MLTLSMSTVRQLHSWDLSYQEARELQNRLADQVIRRGEAGPVHLVAGVDGSYQRSTGLGTAAVVVVEYPAMTVVEVKTHRGKAVFPYIPGLLSFRESPLVLAAWERLMKSPDLVMVDGQGIAHPRRLGIASHLGLFLDLPTIGCAKSLLVGEHAEIGQAKGSWSEVVDRGEVVAAALRTKEGARPVYVSIGHRVDLELATKWTLACCRGYRLPEPARMAHLAATGRLAPVAAGAASE